MQSLQMCRKYDLIVCPHTGEYVHYKPKGRSWHNSSQLRGALAIRDSGTHFQTFIVMFGINEKFCIVRRIWIPQSEINIPF